jgi:hypothetical protein
MAERTLEELQALQSRLEGDLRRSRMIDPDGITRNTPLIRNLEQVRKDIQTVQTKTTTNAEIIT